MPLFTDANGDDLTGGEPILGYTLYLRQQTGADDATPMEGTQWF